MKKLFVLLTVIVTMAMAQAQEMSRPQLETGRVAEAVGLYENGDNQKAIELLLQEIGVNKKNGYAYFYMAYLVQYSSTEQLGLTEDEGQKMKDIRFLLYSYDKALKYLPKKDKYYQSLCYYYKAMIFQANEYFEESNKMLDKGFKLNKDIDFLQEKGQNYIFMGKYDVAKAMFEETYRIQPTSANCVGIAVACINLEQYDEAIEMARKAVAFADDRMPWALAQLARAYVLKGDLPSAIEPAIDSYMMDPLEWVGEILEEAKIKHPELLVSRLKIALVEYPNKEGVIKDFLSRIYYWELDDSRNAIKYATDVKTMYPDYLYPYTLLSLAQIDLGEYDKAICNLDTVIELDSLGSSVYYYFLYHLAYYGQGLLDKSLEFINKAIELELEEAVFYANRAKIYHYMGKLDDAIDDYSMAITMDPMESYYVLYRGILLKKQNKNVAAETDFNKVIEMDSVRGSETAFAYFYLGDNTNALEVLIEGYASKKISDYNAACLYSLMGQKEMALRYLERMLEMGYRNFSHINFDTDLDNIKDMPEFKALIDRYKNQ